MQLSTSAKPHAYTRRSRSKNLTRAQNERITKMVQLGLTADSPISELKQAVLEVGLPGVKELKVLARCCLQSFVALID